LTLGSTLQNDQPDTSFGGNVIVGSSQTTVQHEFAFMPFIGHEFNYGFVYFGAGPAVFRTKGDLYNVTGYADINGTHADITGTPTNYSSSQWLWGAAAELGAAYYFSPTWFADLNYTYAMTGNHTTNYSSPFASSTDGYDDTGTLYASTTNRVIAQSVALSINKVF